MHAYYIFHCEAIQIQISVPVELAVQRACETILQMTGLQNKFLWLAKEKAQMCNAGFKKEINEDFLMSGKYISTISKFL